MFAAYDQLADPAIFRQVLSKLPRHREFPQEMCQLIIKDFELWFGKVPEVGEGNFLARTIQASKKYAEDAGMESPEPHMYQSR